MNKNLTFILIILISALLFTTPAFTMQSFGRFGNDSEYTPETIAENTGRLIIFTCPDNRRACDNPVYTFTPNYFIQINGKKIASIYGMQYLDVNLPIGTYSIDVVKHNKLDEDSIASSFEVLIKEHRLISIILQSTNDEGTTHSTYQVPDINKLLSFSFLGMKFNKAVVNESELNSISESYLRNVSEVLIKERNIKNSFTTKSPVVTESESKPEVSQAEYIKQLNSYKDADLKREADDAIVIDAAKQEAANLRQAKESMRQKEAKIAEEKRQKESDMLEAKRQREVEDALAKKDDATCKSYGGKKGTQAYIQCRVSLVVSRQEASDRQKTMDALEKKIETLQSQIQSQAAAQSQAQERDRRLSAEQYASEQEFKNKQIELQQAQLRTLQQEAQSAREARKWQNIQKSLDAMGTVTPAAPSPFSSYRIDGRTYRCTDIGGQVNCR
jgi:hypothetical protein